MNTSALFKMALAAVALLFLSPAARAELMVGDPAPQLQTGQWVQGEPLSGFDSNHVYIVEFWATWCGPCVQSIPHLNQLAQKYQDQGVIVIGQDVWDSDAAVAPFVRKMGANMTYRVALDDKSSNPDGAMASAWWPRKVNGHGIPTAFIINRDGVIAWIGHPMNLRESNLDEIISGHQDLAQARSEYQKNFAANRQFQELQATLNSSLKQMKWDDAQAALDKIDILFPQITNSFVFQRLKILLGRRNFAGAFALADSVSRKYPADDFWQNGLAWAIAISDGPDQHCLDLAETCARRAVDLTAGTNSGPLDTLARVQFMSGKKSEAIATEIKALGVEQAPAEKAFLEKTLLGYRADKLPKVEE